MVLTRADVEKYINRFENAVTDPKKRKIKKLEIARLYKDAKMPEKAKECVEEYLEITQKDHRAFNLLGTVNEELSRWEDALKCFKKSIELECTQKDIFLKIIEIYTKVPVNQPHIAKVWADKAAKVFPRHPSVFNLKWHLLKNSDEKDYEEMEDILAQELVANPRDVSLHIKLVNLYIEKDDLNEAYVHCSSLLESGAFQNIIDWLHCTTQVFEKFYKKNSDSADGIKAYMKFLSVHCLLVNESFKTETIGVAKSLIQRLDKAVNEAHLIDNDSLTENLRQELKVFQTESRGQLYFQLARYMMKMAKECEIPWNVASKYAGSFLLVSSSIREPNTKAEWFVQKSSQGNRNMIWHTMACCRLSQTDHQILSLIKKNGEKWTRAAMLDTCSQAGKQDLIERIYQDTNNASSSFFARDKAFLKPEFEVPDAEKLLKYDEVAIINNPEDLNFLIWIGINWHFLDGCMKPEVVRLIWRLFYDLPMDVENIKNCSPFSVSSKDLEVFIEAVVYSAYNKFVENHDVIKEEFEPALLPVEIGSDLVTSSQKELWNAVYKLQTGKTWQASTSKLKSVVQKGLESLRVIGNHGIDARILKYVSDTFLSKAENILDETSNEWKNQSHLESLQKRGYYYAIEALRILEISQSDNEIPQPKRTLIEPLVKPLKEKERNDLITEIRMMMADAAFRDNLHSCALKYLGELYTADSAYKEAQVYRDLATKENLANIEGLRNHLSNLRKSRERLQTCLSRLDEAQVALRSGVQSEIDEIRDAIAEQSGISAAPSKILDFRYSTLEETENEDAHSFEEAEDSSADSKLVMENSMLHEQLAVRNHEFSVLAQRIYKLEREIVDLRKDHSGSESMIRPGNDMTSLSGNTDESSSSVAFVTKDDATSGSGNLTPRLEPEMSWDPFSPAPVFPVFDKGFFSGLVDTVDKIDEETETEVQEAEKESEDETKNAKDESPEKLQPKSPSVNELEDEEASHGDNIYVEPVVQLSKNANQKTGEEGEEMLLLERAKLYRLTDSQWKERGVGDFKILFNPKTQQSRILMRRDHVLRICANHVITRDIKLERKEGSATTFIWFTVADMSEQSPKPETFAVRFKNEQIANKFEEVFKSCQKKRDKLDGAPSTGNDVRHSDPVQSASSSSSPPKISFGEIKDDKGNDKKGFVLAPTKLDFSDVQDKKPQQDKKKFDFSGFKFNLSSDTLEKPEESKPAMIGGLNTKEETFKLTPSRFVSSENVEKKSTEEDTKSQFPNVKFDFGGKVGQPNVALNPAGNPFGNSSVAVDGKQNNPFFAAFQNNLSADKKSSPFSFTSSPNIQQNSFGQFGDNKAPFSFSNTATSLSRTESTLNAPFSFLPLQTSIADKSTPTTSREQSGNFEQSNSIGQAAAPVNPFQSSWEAMQDKYYCEGAYADQDQYYVDEDGYYGNEGYYNGSGYYSNDDDEDYDNEDAYYANEDGEIDYYDQEAVKPVSKGDSDANSDRQSPQDDQSNTDEPVPRVVQMIGEDVFVTFVKKASFAERARAARLQLPTNFFSPSLEPPCKGCLGCAGMKLDDSQPSSASHSEAKTSGDRPQSTQNQQIEKPLSVSSVSFGSSAVLGANSSLQSFSDFVKSNKDKSLPFQTGDKAFSGAGSVLFTSDKNDEDSEAYDPQYKAIIELEKKDNQVTGEEGYVHLFKHRAKLYRFDSELKQWKERGVGDMKLSHNPENNYCRVLMRRDIIHKLCANHPIMPDIELKPHDLSTTSWVWVSGADYSEGEPSVEKFAVKLKNKDICDEFKRVFEVCQQKMVSYVENLKKKQSNVSEVISEAVVLKSKIDGINLSIGSDKTATNELGQSNAMQDRTKTADSKGDNGKQISVWSKFAAQSETWECSVCMINNKPDLTVCASCTAAKDGSTSSLNTSVQQNKKPAGFSFGSTKPMQPGSLFGSSTPISFPTSSISGSSFSFGKSDANTSQKSGQNVFSAQTATAPLQNKDLPEANKEGKTTDWKSLFARKPESWECPTCMIYNDSNMVQCPACSTAKPCDVKDNKTENNKSIVITKSDDEKPVSGFSFGSIKSTQPGSLFGSSTPISFPTSSISGSSFSFGKPIDHKSSPKKPDFGLNKPASEEKDTAKDSAALPNWECPTCSMSNQSAGKNCSGCKTENPASLKERPSTPIVLKKSPVADKASNLRSLFAPKQGSWECPTCLIQNESKVEECPACTTAKPGSQEVENKATESAKSFSTPVTKSVAPCFFGFRLGSSFDTPKNSKDLSIKNDSANSSQFFTPTGAFTFGKQQNESEDKKLFAFETPEPIDASKASNEGKTPESPSKGDDHSLHFAAIVELQRTEHQLTGEEKEDIVFAEKTKLYRFDSTAKQWKERGVGELKILHKNEVGRFRIIMRRDQVHKLCANHQLIEGMILKPMENSERAFIWNTAADYCDEEVRPETFAARFKSVSIAKEFERAFIESVEKTASSKNNAETKEKEKIEKPKESCSFNEEKESNRKEQDAITITNKDEAKEEFNLKVTYQFIPDEEELIKAEKLLLNKEFYHVPSSEAKREQKEDNEEGLSSTDAESNAIPSNTVLNSPQTLHNEEECKVLFKPIVELKQVEFKTGEESEDISFCEKAKVYRLDSSISQWKERGAGDLKILKNSSTGRARLIMRRDQVKNVCVNHLILNGMKLEDSSMSKRTVIWFTLADNSEGEPKAEKFAARFKTDDAFNEFKACFAAVSSGKGESKDESTIREMPKTEKPVKEKNETSSQDRELSVSDVSKTENESEISNAEVVSSDSEKSAGLFGSNNKTISGQFSFLASDNNATAKPKGPEKSLFDFTSTVQTNGKFEFPSKLGNMFSLGSLGAANQPTTAVEETVSDNEVKSFDVTSSSSSSGPNFGTFNWGKPTGSLFSFVKNESKMSNLGEGADERTSGQNEANEIINAKPVFSWPTSQGDSKQPNRVEQQFQEGNKLVVEVSGQSPASTSVNEEYHAEEECKANFEAIVTLQKKEQVTGEEFEETVFCERAKAYLFDSNGPQWKERGVGEVKILRNIKSNQHRILMRRDQVKKICMNHVIMPEMKIEPNENSKNCWVWFCHADFSEEQPKAEKFAVRFRNEDAYCRFKENFDQARSVIQERLSGKEAEGSTVHAIKQQTSSSEANSPRDSATGNTHSDEAADECGQPSKEDGEKSTDHFITDVIPDQKREAEKPNLSLSEDFSIVYVKEPSEEERRKAERLLLPLLFFAPNNLLNNPREMVSDAKVSSTVEEKQSSKSTSKMPSLSFQSAGLSFSDLLKTNTDSSPLFKTCQNKAFEQQGQVLFQAKSEGDDEEGYEAQLNFQPIVTLEKKEMKTGEEEEKSLFDERCKLYRFDNTANQWKERGVGNLKILQNKTRDSYRIVMRRDQIYKVCANHLIQIDMKPFPRQGIETTWLWKTNADISEGTAQEEMFTARFKSAEIGKMFAKTFESCSSALQSRAPCDSKYDIEERPETTTRLKGKESTVIETGQEKDTLSLFRATKNGWECNGCLVINQWEKMNCIACGAPRVKEVSSQKEIQNDTLTSTCSAEPQNKVVEESQAGKSTFGSGISAVSFASLASVNKTAFGSPEKAAFSGAGKVLFGASPDNAPPDTDPHYEPIIQLSKVETKSGEENESILFESRTKLYIFNTDCKQWKERGIGVLKLLRHNENGKGRLVMRREQVHKVCANHALTEGMKLDRMTSSNRTLMWKTMADMSEGRAEEALLAARLKSDDVLQDFQRVFEMLCENRPVKEAGSCCPSISADLKEFIENK